MSIGEISIQVLIESLFNLIMSYETWVRKEISLLKNSKNSLSSFNIPKVLF